MMGPGPSQNFSHFKEHVLGKDSAPFLSLVHVAEERQNKTLETYADGTLPLALFWYKYPSKTRNLK